MRPHQFRLFDGPPPSPTLRDVAEAVREAGIDGLPEARRRADSARYQEVHARSALVRVRGMPFGWALNPYRGCTHACEYCYARKYQRHLDLDAGDDFSGLILVKANLDAVLKREVTRAAWHRERVAVGTATDPYQPIEGHYRLTRRCLAVLVESGTPFSLVTKGPMVVRDIDLLRRATAGAGCQVYISVPSADPAITERLEPGVASPRARLRAARELVRAGIETGALMMPLVPGLTTSRSSIRCTVEAIAAAGVPCAGSAVARLDPGMREYFMAFLSREFPELLAGYQRLYRGSTAAHGYVARVRATVAEARAAVGRQRPSRA